MRRFFLLLLLLALAACAASAAPPEDEPTPTPLPTPVKLTFTVQRGDVIRQADFFGRVAPVVSQELFFAMDGRVDKVYVAPGDEVKAGQLLADLTTLADLQQEWAAALQEAAQQEEAARHVVRRAEIDLEIAKLTLEQYKLERRSEFESRIQELQVERAQMALDEVKADPALHTASAKMKELEAAMAKAQLTAPIAGTVIAAVSPGQSVKTTATAFVIGDVSRLEVSAEANSTLLKELVEDMPATVTLESQPDRPLDGAIRRLPYPYGSGSSENNDDSVRVSLPASSGYPVGDQARVIVTLGQKQNALWLPPEAIRLAGGRTFVFVQTDSGPKQVNLITGVQTRERVEIVEGLSEGQVVIGP